MVARQLENQPSVGNIEQPDLGSRSVPATFERKDTTFTDTFDVGPTGATFRVPSRGTPTDGVSVQISANSVEQLVKVSIGYSTGSVTLKAGTPSGTVLVLKTTPGVTFRNYVTIGVSFPPNPKYKTLVGYAIDQEGRLRPVDLIDLDMKQGRVSFLTFQPLMLTWVYIDKVH